MKYYVEESLSNFQFWSGGKDRADLLTSEQLDEVEKMFEECEPDDGWSDTAINDFFWFDFDTIAQWLGYDSETHLEKDIKHSEVEEAQEWAEDMSTDYDKMFAIANLNAANYNCVDEDGDIYYDWNQATEDFMAWWDNLDSIKQVEEYRKYLNLKDHKIDGNFNN